MPRRTQNLMLLQILIKMECNFHPVGDIASFKRTFYSAFHAECIAPTFQSGNKPRRSRNPTVRQILTKIDSNFLPVGDMSSFKRAIYSVLHAECIAPTFQSGNKPRRSQNPTVRQILAKIDCNFLPVGDMSLFKGSFYPILFEEHSARCLKR
jgi:hypothetical protein